MHLEPFGSRFPELAFDECRFIIVQKPAGGVKESVPAAMYGLIEFYCSDRNCDCRRVTLQVAAMPAPQPLVTISYGFDRDDAMAGPFIDPLHRCCSYGNELLALVEEQALADPEYVARLERHYYQMKAATGSNPALLYRRLDPAAVQSLIAHKAASKKQRTKQLRLIQKRRAR